MLEEKVVKVIDKIKVLTEENRNLGDNIEKHQEALSEKDQQIAALRQELKDVDKLKANIEKLNSERETVKTQVEDLIKELEAVEL
jgi:prefoldin subunit 5